MSFKSPAEVRACTCGVNKEHAAPYRCCPTSSINPIGDCDGFRGIIFHCPERFDAAENGQRDQKRDDAENERHNRKRLFRRGVHRRGCLTRFRMAHSALILLASKSMAPCAAVAGGKIWLLARALVRLRPRHSAIPTAARVKRARFFKSLSSSVLL